MGTFPGRIDTRMRKAGVRIVSRFPENERPRIIPLVLCHSLIFEWLGLKGEAQNPGGFLRCAHSNPSHPIRILSCDRALVTP